MALAATLSAMREIILNDPQLPQDADARLATLKARFPALQREEAEDLAQIPLEKWAIYTNSIYCAERNLILRNFPLTIDLLERSWSDYSTEKFSLLSITKAVHKTFPWKSTRTVDLGFNFIGYLKQNYLPLHKKMPFLYEVALLELLFRDIRRAPNDEVSANDSLTYAELMQMKIEDIMQLYLQIPSSVRFQIFDYDVVKARANYHNNGKVIPQSVEVKRIYIAAARDRNCRARTALFRDKTYAFLLSLQRDYAVPLADLAQVFLDSADWESEQAAFKEFIQEIGAAVESGALVLLR